MRVYGCVYVGACCEKINNYQCVPVLSNRNAFVELGIVCYQGTPQPLETYIDSKKEVDQQLKTTCEDFIRHVADDLLWALKAFLTKVRNTKPGSDCQLHSRE